MGKCYIEPFKEENMIVQFTEPFELTKKEFLTVPRQYKAYVYIDEKLELVVDHCTKKKFYEILGKDRDYLKQTIQIAFVNTVFPRILWGVGDIQVKNDKLKNAYRVGGNGECVFEVINDRVFINNFKFGNSITLDDIKKKTLTIIQMAAKDALSTMFADTQISVFEINSKTEEIRDAIINSINDEKSMADLGIKINSLTVSVFIPEEDLLMIKSSING